MEQISKNNTQKKFALFTLMVTIILVVKFNIN